jgi:alpha-amylase
LPRINALQSDKKKVYNAFAGTFLYGGIPVSYYGSEQDIADGDNDPRNREALWLYNNYATDGQSYQFIKSLNQIRKGLSKTPNWGNSVASVVGVTQTDIALKRGGSLIVLTNVSEL